MNTKIAAAVLAIATLAAVPASSSADQAKCFRMNGVRFYSSAPNMIDAKVSPAGLPAKDVTTTVQTYRDGLVEYREVYRTRDDDGDRSFDFHYYQVVPMSWAGENVKTTITVRSGSCVRRVAGYSTTRTK